MAPAALGTMPPRRVLLAAGLLLLSQLNLVAAASAAYIGCFTLGALAGLRAPVDLPAARTGNLLAAACLTRCTGLRHPLAVLQLSGRCACSSIVPDAAARAPAGSCSEQALSGQGASAAAVFYAHDGMCTYRGGLPQAASS
jgi:hypothetical protein